MRNLFYLLLIFLPLNSVFGQDKIVEKMDWYQKSKPKGSLFVHFDKNIYANNETVYLTGYVYNVDSISLKKHSVLSVALVRDVDNSIVVQQKFLMENGLAFGNITLLDSMMTGKYHFIAYTNQIVNDMPEVMFSQNVLLKTPIEPAFSATMKFLDDKKKDDKKTILISVVSREGRFLPGPIQINYRYGTTAVTTKADKSGQLMFTVPQDLHIDDPNVYVKVKYGSDSSFISLAVPQVKNRASVKFYPEGGEMINGLPSIIGWEAKDQQKRPLRIKGLLFQNGRAIDTIETNIYGIGKFYLTPDIKNNYTVKLLHSAFIDSTYLLPNAQQSGIVLTLRQAVVTDTLRAIVKSTITQKLTIRIHNFRTCFLTAPFTANTASQRIKIPLTEMPKGLMTITVTDSLDRPLAERIFFAHYRKERQLTVTTDKDTYGQREKVTLKLKLHDQKAMAVVSIAGVQDSRLSVTNTQDIVNFTYLTNELTSLPNHLSGNPLADEDYLEQVLLVKGWRKYNWRDLENANANISPVQTDSLTFTGKLSYSKKNFTVGNVIGYGTKRMLLFPTDTEGNFNINFDQLVVPPGARLFLLLNKGEREKLKDDYIIKVNDPYQVWNSKLARILNVNTPIVPSTLLNNRELVLKTNEKSILLKEVVIGPRAAYFKGNECGDYVCPYNILNCVNHIGFSKNTLPVVGKYYLKYSGMPDKVEYKGCYVPNESVFFQVKPIYTAKEFYLSDYKDPQEPAFFSTIYWNYCSLVGGEKEAEFSFYTGDIVGKFKIVAQGVSDKDVVYSEHFFEVKEN